MALVDGIKYQRLGDEHYYAQERFATEELTGYLRNMIDAKKSVHEHVVYDLGGERAFAEGLEKNTAIKVYAKLPGWFVVLTPLGNYNPDWAIAFQEGKVKHVYFVAETKGSMSSMDLRKIEENKIECARKFFAKITSDQVKYDVVDGYGKLMELVK